MRNLYRDYHVIVRKKIASIKRSQPREQAAPLIKAHRTKLEGIVDLAEVLKTIHDTKHTEPRTKCAECVKLADDVVSDVTMGKLLDVLERMVKEEEAQNVGKPPTQTGIERWALKIAVRDFYRGLNVPSETKIMDDPTQYKTLPQYAPITKDVYQLWLQRLTDLINRHDSNRFDLHKLDEDKGRGIEQGGAFEKALQRFREEFMKRVVYE